MGKNTINNSYKFYSGNLIKISKITVIKIKQINVYFPSLEISHKKEAKSTFKHISDLVFYG